MIEIGTKVREIATGDLGTVMGENAGFSGGVWVKWETGKDEGNTLHIPETSLEEVGVAASELRIAECMKMLIDAGYTVTKG
jgi:hypothetical protein